MKAGTLQVVWHAKEPVYSLDFHPGGLLVTAGGDKDVKVSRDGGHAGAGNGGRAGARPGEMRAAAGGCGRGGD